jgi:hypothetical protein
MKVIWKDSREYKTMLYYKGLIEMRKAYGIFTDVKSVVDYTESGSGILAVSFTSANGEKALAVINPHNTALPYTLDGEWKLVADGNQAGSKVIATESGSITAEAISVRIYVK